MALSHGTPALNRPLLCQQFRFAIADNSRILAIRVLTARNLASLCV
jgi:hypothetical protein